MSDAKVIAESDEVSKSACIQCQFPSGHLTMTNIPGENLCDDHSGIVVMYEISSSEGSLYYVESHEELMGCLENEMFGDLDEDTFPFTIERHRIFKKAFDENSKEYDG